MIKVGRWRCCRGRSGYVPGLEITIYWILCTLVSLSSIFGHTMIRSVLDIRWFVPFLTFNDSFPELVKLPLLTLRNLVNKDRGGFKWLVFGRLACWWWRQGHQLTESQGCVPIDDVTDGDVTWTCGSSPRCDLEAKRGGRMCSTFVCATSEVLTLNRASVVHPLHHWRPRNSADCKWSYNDSILAININKLAGPPPTPLPSSQLRSRNTVERNHKFEPSWHHRLFP